MFKSLIRSLVVDLVEILDASSKMGHCLVAEDCADLVLPFAFKDLIEDPYFQN